MKTFLATVASAALAISVASGAFAQANPLTVNDVPAANPFGDINVAAAGTTPDAIKTWADALTADQRAEIGNRCGVVSQNQANYQADATSFCTAYLSAYPADAAAGAGAGGAMAPAAPR